MKRLTWQVSILQFLLDLPIKNTHSSHVKVREEISVRFKYNHLVCILSCVCNCLCNISHMCCFGVFYVYISTILNNNVHVCRCCKSRGLYNKQYLLYLTGFANTWLHKLITLIINIIPLLSLVLEHVFFSLLFFIYLFFTEYLLNVLQ